ncbi:MAG: hypothetical protein AMXMBFR64_56250 [Myxococcales bacterium]
MSGAIIQRGDVTAPVEDAADVVIVGTGAAGATAARVLTAAGLDVILVEEGPRVPTTALRPDVWSGFSTIWRDMGAQTARGRSFIPVLQGVCVGGTTAINGAIIHRTPEPILAEWRREHGATLDPSDLGRIWDTLETELSIAPTPEDALGRNNTLMRAGAEALGIRGNVIQRNVDGCRASSRCLQGCPTDRRQSMNVTYIPRAVAAGARVYATCRAERVTTRGGRAAGVEARFRDPITGTTGPTARLHARRAVIVAASAIQTPLLLAKSGVGGRSGQLGRRLQAHPGTAVVGVFDEPVRIWEGATQGWESLQFWDERMKFESVALPLELGAVRLPGIGAPLMRDLARYGHVAQWGVQVRARAHGRVRRSLLGTSITYDLTNDDVRTLKTGVVRLTEMAFAAGAREVLPGVAGLPERISSPDAIRRITDLPDDPRLFHCIAAHLFGTAVMGPDPATSVVSPDGQVHDLPGLWVADSSPFPTNLGVNPQHTICAFAWTVAERVAAG